MNSIFNGMFGKVAPEMCRLSINGGIAVKTSGGYKTFNVKNGQLTNCDNFVFSVGEEFFFVIPAKKVKSGDIILVSGKPRCVIKAEKNMITVINYEDSTIENIVPERHIFMGNTFFFRKIVSMFGNGNGKKGMGKIMRYMMLSQMMNGNGGKNDNSMSALLPLMLMSGGKTDDMFGDMFDFDTDDDDEDEGEEEE